MSKATAPAADDRPPALPEGEQSVDVGPTRLTAEELEETHPCLPPGWARTMGQVRRRGGPWHCPTCDGASLLCYRCSKCGSLDLT